MALLFEANRFFVMITTPIFFLFLLTSVQISPPVSCIQQGSKVIKIGAIFEGSNPELETVFRRSIDRINLDRTRLSGARLEGLVAKINQRDSFHAAKVGQSFFFFQSILFQRISLMISLFCCKVYAQSFPDSIHSFALSHD